jgi:hypothetical protein
MRINKFLFCHLCKLASICRFLSTVFLNMIIPRSHVALFNSGQCGGAKTLSQNQIPNKKRMPSPDLQHFRDGFSCILDELYFYSIFTTFPDRKSIFPLSIFGSDWQLAERAFAVLFCASISIVAHFVCQFAKRSRASRFIKMLFTKTDGGRESFGVQKKT